MMASPLRGRDIGELSRDYLEAVRMAEELGLDEALRGRLEAYRDFIARQGHRIGPYPSALHALAHAEPQDSVVRREALTGDGQPRRLGRPWFRLLHPPQTNPNPALRRVLSGHDGWVLAVALSADGRHALSGSNDKTLRWWDVHTGECRRVLAGHDKWVNAVALSSDGRHALSGSRDRTLRWWDLRTGQCRLVLERHDNDVAAVALSADGGHALSGGGDGTLRWWDLRTGRCLATFPCEYPVRAAALSQSPAGIVAAGLSNGSVLFFQIEAP
jgi:WD40 repeat protein